MSSAASSSREVESANDRYAIEHPHGDWHVASAATPPCPRPTGIACEVEPCWCRAAQDRDPRIFEASEAGSLPDNKEGRYEGPAKLSERQRATLDLIRARGPMSAAQAKIELTGAHPGRGGVMRTTLRSLERRGLVSYRDGLWSAT